ncbi:hypothetical protein GX50_02811 [[Emmonsia] crescens]|uniref:Uncharacterized protein n=1 Tax=[Emmonsia] crescens TaxID=73230 RepID=A0A2B7ZMC8_9EURO|nr:hypothetical protein GX50_02811 [Emmonsia crescens]
MAAKSSENTMRAAFEQLQGGLRELLASGILEPEEEIQIRTILAGVLLKKYEYQRALSDLYSAINHLECVAPHLPKSTEGRVECLDHLSYMKISAFGITYAIRNQYHTLGRLRPKQSLPVPSCTCTRSITALDTAFLAEPMLAEATMPIWATRLFVAAKFYVWNRASPLNMRHPIQIQQCVFKFGIPGITERKMLKRPLPSSIASSSVAPPGTPQHGHALVAKGEFADDLKDLDEALFQLQDGLARLPADNEKRVETIRRVGELYECKYDFQGATKETIRLRDHVPIGHAKWHFSGLCVGNMLARRYILSHQIRDLMEVMKHAIETCREFDNLQQRNGIRRKIDISPLCELSPWLSKINNVPFDTPATRQAQEKVYR